MGKSLTYCFKCSRLIREEEFARGKAFNLGDRVSCSDCARETGAVVVPGAPPAAPAPSPPTRSTPRKVVIVQQQAPAKHLVLLGVGGFALVGILIAVGIAFSGGPEPGTTFPAPGAPSPREAAARQSLESARRMGGELKAKRLAMEKVASDYGDTAAGADARKDLAVLRDLSRELWQRDSQQLEAKIREPLARRKFETVVALLEEALKLDSDPGWTEPLRKRIREVREETAKLDPDLIVHYTFDEGQGTEAQDSSGRGPVGQITGATWTDGRIGKALKFNGVRSFVDLPNTPVLDTLQEKSFTIAAWFRPDAEPPVKEGNTGYAIVMKDSKLAGLILKSKFHMDFWLSDGSPVGAVLPAPNHQIGRFYHLAGVVDRNQGLVRLVIDGKEAATTKIPPTARVYDFKKMHWRIGMGATQPGQRWAVPANGVIDDVRFYQRALNDEEIRLLIPK